MADDKLCGRAGGHCPSEYQGSGEPQFREADDDGGQGDVDDHDHAQHLTQHHDHDRLLVGR
jgi:hypothetical protein